MVTCKMHRRIAYAFLASLLLAAVRGFLFEKFEQSDCAHSQADILFILDMSEGVTEQDFEKEKSFVIDFIGHIDVQNQEYQVAVTSYSSGNHDIVYFNSGLDNQQLMDKIRSSTYRTGKRHLDYALSHVGSNFFHHRGGRAFAAKIAFLITAGPVDKNQDRVDKYALYIPSHYNVTLFVIAVTANSHVPGVAIIAQNQRHLFQINSFSELDTISDELLITLCQDVIHGRSCYDASSLCYRYSCTSSYSYRCPRYCGLCSDGPTKTSTSVRLTTNDQMTMLTTLPHAQQSISITSTTSTSTTVVQTKTLTSLPVLPTSSINSTSNNKKCPGSDIVCMDDPMAQCKEKQALFGICSTHNSAVINHCPVLCGVCLQYCQIKESQNGIGTTLATNTTEST